MPREYEDGEADFTNTLPESLFDAGSKYLIVVLAVDSVLKADDAEQRANRLAELINYLSLKRSPSEQNALCVYALTQAYSYRRDFPEILDGFYERFL